MQSEINKTILPNGLTVLSEFVPGVRSISAGVWIKAGSRHENPHNKGIAHFLEHMVFKGTAKRSALKIAHSLEESGGSLNAYTSKELTVFYAHSLDKQLTKNISVLADLVCNPLLRDQDIINEKQIILEEINAVHDTPEDLIFDLFQEKLFPDQAMGFPILGTEKSVNSLNYDILTSFWEDHYYAQNIVLSVAGNVNHQKLVRLAERYFIFRNQGKTIYVLPPKASFPVKFEVKDPVNQCHICTGVESISYLADERYPVIALNTYLGNGMSSRLFQVIREKYGLAYSVYSFVDFFIDTGIFGFYLGTDVKKSEKALSLLYMELDKLTQNQIKKTTVEKIKGQLTGNLLLGLESTQRRMSRIAKNEIYFKRQYSIEQVTEEIRQINPQNMLETSQKIFNIHNFNTVTILPYA